MGYKMGLLIPILMPQYWEVTSQMLTPGLDFFYGPLSLSVPLPDYSS
jgi:hypothetical protein